MKSKTSCFNSTIFKKNFSQYWLLVVVYFGYLFVALPMKLFLEAKQATMYYEGYPQNMRQYMVMSNALDSALQPIVIFAFAGVMALAVFSYLYSARSANMIHALPVNRFELFVTNYLTGIGFLLAAELLAFVAAVFVCLANQISCIQYLFWWLLNVMGITVFAFSMAVFVAMFTGNIVAMAVYYAVANYLYVGCYYLLHLLVAEIGYGISDTWNPNSSCILSPMYYINNNVNLKRDYDAQNYVTGISFEGYRLVIFYVIVAVVLTAAAYLLYRIRKIETAGDIISVKAIKPIFRWGVAICGGMALTQEMLQFLRQYMEINVFVSIIVFIILFGAICFFVAEMLLQKKFWIFTKRCLAECVACVGVTVFTLALVKADVFGIEKRIPDADEIERAYINMDYAVVEKDLDEMRSLHENLISHKADYANLSAKSDYVSTIVLRYYRKDGTMFERSYRVPIDETALSDAGTPSAIVRSIESRPENVRDQIFNSDGENANYYAGYIERMDETGATSNYSFSKAQIDQLIEAANQDIEEGNFDQYLFYQPGTEVFAGYWNSICLEFTGGTNYMYGTWYEYENYNHKESREMYETVVTGNMYLSSFGPECRHLVQALYDMGAVDDEWKLITMEEYENLTK